MPWSGKVLTKMVLDGAEMMVPEEDCVWTKQDGKLHKIFTLGEGFSLFEFEGLSGTFEERLQQVKDNREAALKDHPKKTPVTKKEPKRKIIISPDPDPDEPRMLPWFVDSPEPEKPKKKTTSDWLFDN